MAEINTIIAIAYIHTMPTNLDLESVCPGCGQPIRVGHNSNCPLGRNDDDSKLLESTIFNRDKIIDRGEKFDSVWQQRWQPKGAGKESFQVLKTESPFAEYSSKGWKVHIAFTKGQEKTIAKLLYSRGLYFKVEAGSGTYFNGLKESGATVYIGSHNNMQTIAKVMEMNLQGYLTDGAIATAGSKTIRMGSGSDVEVLPKITARFDIAKTPLGWHSGNRKYAEHGLPSWMGLGGIPILKKYEGEISEIVSNWNGYLDTQRKIYFERRIKPIYEESKKELIKDFGKEFVFGE